jgi:hypothetical protein
MRKLLAAAAFAAALTCNSLLPSVAVAADGERRQPPTAPAQPELTTLAAAPVDTAAGEGDANRSRGVATNRVVEVDGKTVPLQEQTIELERTWLKGLYRHGLVPK